MNLHVSPRRATDDLLTQPNLRLRVGEHVIDVGALRVVTRPELPRLTSKAVAVLIELVRHVGATVKRDELLDRVWTGRFPTPDVLTQAIKELRRAFGDDARPSRYIETIPKVGYRLLVSVLVLDGPDGEIFVESAPSRTMDDDAPGTNAAPANVDAVAHAVQRESRTPQLLLLGAIALLAGVLVALGWLLSAQRAAATPEWRVSDARSVTSDPGSEYRPHLSPDGTRVAYSIFDPQSQVERVVIRSVEPSQQIHLTASSKYIEGLPVWSPDGSRIAFERLGANHCEMFVASGLGGSEREVGKCQSYYYNYYDWMPDGHRLVFDQREAGAGSDLALFVWNLDSGLKEPLQYQRSANDQDLDPRVSPDGTRIAFRRRMMPYSDLYVMPVAGGAPRQLTHISASIHGYTWTADSRSLVFSSDYKGIPALYAIDTDRDGAEPKALDVSPAQYPNAGRHGDAIVYEITRTQAKMTLRPFTDKAASRVLAPSTGSDFTPVMSPSGDRVVFVSNRSGHNELWLYELAGGLTSPLTEDVEASVSAPRWNADGSKVVAIQRDASGRKFIEVDVASHRQRVLSKADDFVMFGDYAAAPDSYLLALGPPGRSSRLIELTHPGTPREKRKTLVEGIVHARMDAPSHSVYYTKTDAQGLFRRNLDTGIAQLVTKAVSADLISAWRIVDGHVWYLSDLDVRSATLHDLDPVSAEDRVVTHLDTLMAALSFSVTPAHDAILFAPVTTEDTDVGIFHLARRNGS